MGLDLQRAIKAPFTLENWGVNTLISGILLLVPIAGLIVFGQWLRYLKSVILDKETLEKISGDHFTLGLKYVCGGFLWWLCAALPMGILAMLISALNLNGVTSFILISIAAIWLIFASILLVPMTILFSMDEKIMTMIAFGRGLNFITSNPGDFWFAILLSIIIGIIYGIVMFILQITVIGAILMTFVMVPAYITTYNLYGQLAKETLKKQQAKAL